MGWTGSGRARDPGVASGFALEVGKLVSLGAALADAEESGSDAEGAEVAGEGDLRKCSVRSAECRAGEGVEGSHEVPGEEAGGAGLGEDLADGGQQELRVEG